MEQYCVRRDTWRQVGVLSGRRLQFGVAVIDQRLYVVGGRDGLKTLNTVECYNPRSNTWSIMPPMATHRHGLGETPLSSYRVLWEGFLYNNDVCVCRRRSVGGPHVRSRRS